MNSGPDLFSLKQFVLENWRFFLVNWVIFSLCVAYGTRPRPLDKIVASPLGRYRSSGSILVLPQNESATVSIFGHSVDSDLELWLANQDMFMRFLESAQVRDRIATEVLKVRGELLEFVPSILIVPRLGNSLADDLEAYDQSILEEKAAIVSRHSRGRVTRITIASLATSAKDSKVLCDIGLRVLREAMFEVAMQRVRARRRLIENYVRLGTKRIERSRAAMSSLAGRFSRKTPLLPGESHREAYRQVASEVASLEWQLQAARRNPTSVLGIDPDLPGDEESRSQAEAQRLFLPGSQHYRMALERLLAAKKARQIQYRQRLEQHVVDLQIQLKAKRKVMLQESVELQNELEGQLPPEGRRQLEAAERKLSAWELDLAQWESKLTQIRIEEQVCTESGTAVILQVPLLGKKVEPGWAYLKRRYQRTFEHLPLALLAALTLVLLVNVVRSYNKVVGKQEEIFDAPVLVELPPLPRHRRRWWPKSPTGRNPDADEAVT